MPEAFRAIPRRLKSRRVLLASLRLAPSASAAAGERPWIEIKSPHFSVVSDAGDKRTRLFGYQRIDLSVKVSVEGFTQCAVTPAEWAGARAGLHAAMNRRLEARGLAREAPEADPALAAP